MTLSLVAIPLTGRFSANFVTPRTLGLTDTGTGAAAVCPPWSLLTGDHHIIIIIIINKDWEKRDFIKENNTHKNFVKYLYCVLVLSLDTITRVENTIIIITSSLSGLVSMRSPGP